MPQEICLANLATKTEQEVFDYVARHLLTQNKKAQIIVVDIANDTVPQCKYLTGDGLRCAAGCLIAEDEYKASFEGVIWVSLTKGLVPTAHSKLIAKLQEVHDEYAVDGWAYRLGNVAYDFNLVFNEDKLRATAPSN